jgi:putative nucleotidyltransferase with HDIG domain
MKNSSITHSSTNIPSKETILKFLREKNLSKGKITHSIYVAELALKISDEVIKDEIKVDRNVVKAGGLLHDVGLSGFGDKNLKEEIEDPSPQHCVIGAKIALDANFPEVVVECIESHELWSEDEAKELGFPLPIKRDYIPKTWESKIVAYADLVAFVTTLGYDLLKDPRAVIESSYVYRNKCFEKATGKSINWDHPILKRVDKFNNEMIKYLKQEFIKKY